MSRAAIFFDRDNTLIASDGYLGDPAKVTLVATAADSIARLRRLGFAIVVVSNQSGVARGLFDEAAVRAVNARLDVLLGEQNVDAVIDRHEYCPFHPQAKVAEYRRDSPLRKPSPGMLQTASAALNIDLRRSWMIGDAPRDIAAGRAVGCRTILFRDPSLPPSAAVNEPGMDLPDFNAATLAEAAEHIARSTVRRTDGAPESPSPSSIDDGSLPQSGDVRKLLEQIVQDVRELRRLREHAGSDFAVSKLMAGILQVIVLATLFVAYLHRGEATLQPVLIVALVLQTMTIALLIMSHQR